MRVVDVAHGVVEVADLSMKKAGDEEEAVGRRRAVAPRCSPKNLIPRLPVQDLNGRGFGGLLSRTAVHAIAGMGKTREQRSNGTRRARQTETSGKDL